PGDDLRSRRRTAVDQHDQRLAVREVAGPRIMTLGVVRAAAAGRDDLAAFQEGVGDRDRLIEQAAAVVAQVDDVALQLVGGHLLVDLGDAGAELFERALALEARDAQIADVLALDAGADVTDRDDLADDRDLDRRLDALAVDLELDRGI